VREKNPFFLEPNHSSQQSCCEALIILITYLLLDNEKTNQMCFGKIFFHLIEVAVSIDFAHKNNLFLTGFAHRKFVLWKSCGLDL